MSGPSFSVVVVSRGRPAALARCVESLAQQEGALFEVVAAADPPGLAALDPWGGRIKRVAARAPNISAARNAGAAQAAGEVLAFIDDDAVAEPLWLSRLAEALGATGAEAAAGWVRGPDGHAFAARAQGVRRDGTSRPLPAPADRPALLVPEGRLAPRAEGTNMAVRAATLRALGGFDEGFRFSHDESDLFWRLMKAGGRVASAPLAQVHHGLLPSERRREGVALTLHEVGASLAVWARRRGIEGAPLLAAERERRRRTLLRHMVAGRIEPRDVGRVLGTLEAGFAEGLGRALPPLAPLPPPPSGAAPFLPFRAEPPRRGHRVLLGDEPARPGEAVTRLRLGWGWRRHRTRFVGGEWVQEGGLRGRSGPRPGPGSHGRWGREPVTPEARARAEAVRLAPLRGNPPDP